MSSASHDVSQLLRRLRQAGWAVRRNGADHWCAEHPDGRRITLASSPNRSGFVRDKAKVAKALKEGQDGRTR
jgi:hypothetical protein